MTPRVAFVNGGILGLTSYAHGRGAPSPTAGTSTPSTSSSPENLPLTRADRAPGPVPQLWPDCRGSRNLDLARFRRELNSGLQARHRLLARGSNTSTSSTSTARRPLTRASI